MGKIDEHWCSDCKRTLDKTKDKYLDLEVIRLKVPTKKGLLCEVCLKKPEYKGLRKLLKAGNPDFTPYIECALHTLCKTFKPITSRSVRCRHIAVIGDMIYCKRRHPGSVKLPVERAERLRYEHGVLMKVIRKIFRKMPAEMAAPITAFFDESLMGNWTPPSGVVKAVPVRILPGGGKTDEEIDQKVD